MGNPRIVCIADPGLGWLYRPEFPSEWPRQSLYSMAEWLNGMAFRDIEFTPSGRPVIKIAEIKEGIAGQTKFTDRDYDERYLVRSGDMLFSWSGQPETSLDVSWWQGEEGWLNQHIFKVTPNSEKCTPDFLFYLLKYLKRNIIGIARNKQTTGLGHVTKADMERIEVGVPPKSVQDSITAVLRPLDDLIDLNRRTNETLEQIARALFRHYFPYSPEDDLPQGWRAGTIGDMATLNRSTLNPLKFPEEVFDHYSIPAFDEGRLSKAEKGNVIKSNKVIVLPGSVMISKLNPQFPRVWMPSVVGYRRSICSTEFLVALPVADIYREYLFCLFGSTGFLKTFAGMVTGTSGSHQRVNAESLLRMQAVVPSENAVCPFVSIVRPLLSLVQRNTKQSLTLAALRDLLLPKLLSGELRVSVEAVDKTAQAGMKDIAN